MEEWMEMPKPHCPAQKKLELFEAKKMGDVWMDFRMVVRMSYRRNGWIDTMDGCKDGWMIGGTNGLIQWMDVWLVG